MSTYRQEKEWVAEQGEGVLCPYCNTEHVPDFCEEGRELVTYWGEGDRVEYTCPDCEQIFYVKERVTRSFTSYKGEG